MTMPCLLGSRVVHKDGLYGAGTVRYVGPIEGTKSADEIYIGVEWDDANAGNQDGSYNSTRYFSVSADTGVGASFLKEKKLQFGKSFLEVVEQKYGDTKKGEYGVHIHMGKLVKRDESGAYPFLQNLVVSNCSISSFGSPGAVAALTPALTDLDLSSNLLNNWGQIYDLCEQLPTLQALRISHNHMTGSFLPPSNSESATERSSTHTLLRLGLTGTCVTPDILDELLQYFPQLEELHLAHNDLKELEINPSHAKCLTRLYLSDNCFSSWDSIAVAATLESLHGLFIANNPSLGDPPESLSTGHFDNLDSLNASNTGLATLSGVGRLRSLFPMMRRVRLASNPFSEKFSDEMSRAYVIAMLPYAKSVNGGAVSENERSRAERSFMRTYLHTDGAREYLPSYRFEELDQIHTRPEPLAEVSLRPPEHVHVTLVFRDNFPEVTRKESFVCLKQTVAKFKKLLHTMAFEIFEQPAPYEELRLHYVDTDMVEKVAGSVLMKEERRMGKRVEPRQIWTFNMKDGDEILIDCMPPAPVRTPSRSSR